jgi:small subunit ribosomal protein S6
VHRWQAYAQTPSFFLLLTVAAPLPAPVSAGYGSAVIPEKGGFETHMSSYELVFIITPTVEDDAVQSQIDVVTGWISQLGGEASKVTPWGRRRLAYPIKKFNEGTYVLVNMQLPPAAVRELETNLKISETFIRHMVVCANE